MDEILAAIDDALARKGLSDAAASKLAVGNYALIKNLRSSRAAREEDRRTNFHALQRLAEVLDLECYFGPRRTNSFSGFSEPARQGADGTLPIPWLEPRLGHGSAPIRFSLDWLRSSGLEIEELRAVVPDELKISGRAVQSPIALLAVPSSPGSIPAPWAYREGTRILIADVLLNRDVYVVMPPDRGSDVRVYRRSEYEFQPLGRVVWQGYAVKS